MSHERDDLQEQIGRQVSELYGKDQQLSVLLESLPVVTFTADTKKERTYKFINATVESITGFKPEDFYNKAGFWNKRIHPDDLDTISKGFKKLNKTDSNEYEYRWQVKDGSYKWFREVARLVKRLDGTLQQIGTLEDIHQRKSVEDELQQLSLVASHTNNYVLITNWQGTIEWVNDAFTEITGYSKEEVNGQDVRELLRGPDTDQDVAAKLDALTKSKQSFYEEILNYKKDGEPIWLSMNTTPILTSKKEVRKYITIGSDITLRKEAEEGLKQANRELDERVKERTRELEEANRLMRLEVSLHKRSEKAFRQSEERYRMLIEESVDAIYLHHPETKKIQLANAAFCRMLGYTKEETNQLTIYDFVVDSKRTIDQNTIAVRKSGKANIGERVWKAKDGRMIDMQVTANKIQTLGIETIYVIARDITEQKEKEEVAGIAAKINNTVNSKASLDDLYATIHKAIDKEIDAKNMYLALFNPESNIISFPYNIDEVEGGVEFTSAQLERSLTMHIIKTGKPLLANKEQQHELAQKGKIDLVGKPCLTWIGVPMFSSGQKQAIGVLVVQQHKAKVLNTEKELNMLVRLAPVITYAIERKRTQMQQEITYQIAKTVNVDADLNTLYKLIDQELGTVMDTRNFYIALYNKNTNMVQFPYFKDDTVDPGNEYDANEPRKLGKGMTEYVMRKGKPIFAHQELYNKLINEGEVRLIGELPLVWLGAPLNYLDETIGVIAVQSYTNFSTYTQNDLKLLEFVSDQIATVIQRKQTEEEIRRSEEKYRSLVEKMNEGLVYTNEEESVEFVNDQFCEISGFSRSEIIGENGYQVMLSEEEQERMKARMNDRRKGLSEHYELHLTRKNGEKIWVHVSATPVVDAEGVVSGSMAIMSDITERIMAQEALSKSEEQYRMLVETMNEGIMQIDTNGKIKYVNGRLCEMLGYKKSELNKKDPFALLLYAKDREKLKKKVMNGGTGKNALRESFEIKMKRKSGKDIWGYISFAALTDTDGQVTGLTGIVSDITEKVITEEQLRERNQELNTFMYKASHDLKGPLSSTMGLISLAQEEIKDAIALNYINLIGQGAERLDVLINDLLELTRIKQGIPHYAQIKIEDLLSEQMESLKHVPGYVKMLINVDIQQKRKFHTDRKLLSSIMQNLMENAIKYRDEGKDPKTLDVIVRDKAGGVEIKVVDNGIGIEKGLKKHVFEMFFKANETYRGSGLGLFIVKNAVDSLKGKIKLDSRLGEGTTFTILLPNVPN